MKPPGYLPHVINYLPLGHRQSGESLPSLNVTNTLVLDEPRYVLEVLAVSGSFTIPLVSGINITNKQ